MSIPLRTRTCLLLAVLAGTALVAGPSAFAAESGQPAAASKPLRPLGDCLVARDVRDWVILGEQRLLVRADGGKYFDIALRDRCPDLQKRSYIRFSEGLSGFSGGTRSGAGRGGDPVTTDGRVCGDLGDSVIASGGALTGSEVPCRLESIRRIDKAAYDAASDAATRQKNARRSASRAGG